MPKKPLPKGANGPKSNAGQFQKGHPGGPGNPHAAIVARLRAALLASCTEDDVTRAMDVLREAMHSPTAKWSERISAVEVFMDRVLGRAKQEIDLTAESRGGVTLPEVAARFVAANIPLAMWPPTLRIIEQERLEREANTDPHPSRPVPNEAQK